MTTRLDIISDPICPWCYIGKTRLDRALAARTEHPFEITWRPFQLNPDMPPEGMDRREYLEAKFGGPEGAKQTYGRIAAMAEADGIEANLDAIGRTPNTIDAHRLIRWAGLEGRQGMVVDRLFRAYFVEGSDISDHAVLLEIAEDAGLDRAMIARLFEGDADVAEVREEDRAAREMGVQGVPTFILGGRYAVSGAQDAETWGRIIDEIAEKTREMVKPDAAG